MPETPDPTERYMIALFHGAVTGAVMAIVIIWFLLVTGSTFGQRCETKGFAPWMPASTD